jgi:calcineurin-like phosphoesterase family protein
MEIKAAMKIWIIADTHFYHENIKKFQGRSDDFNEQIIKNWNKLVKYDDLVIHLGDVIFGLNKDEKLPSIMASLPGKKVLCRGNHDLQPAIWYMERGFDFVCDYFVSSDIAFSHVPTNPAPFANND